MNFDNFHKWFVESLLPQIPARSLIVMDNAPWGVVKNHCATQCDFSMKGLREHLDEGFEKVTPATCQAAVEDMRQEEDRHWREDLENEADE